MHFGKIFTITAITVIHLPMPGSATFLPQLNDLQQLLGGKTYRNILAPQDYDYKDGDISLKAGQPISEGLSLSASKLKDFSPATALQAAGINLDLSKTKLGELKFLKKISVETLIATDPTLKSITAESIGWINHGSKTLEQIAATNLGKLPLPESVLNSSNVANFGNITNIPYGSFPGAGKLPVSNFLGLSDIPLSKTIGIITGGSLVRVNRILTNEKNFNTKVVSGSDQRPLAKWDKSTPVNGVELLDSVVADKSNLINGAVAIIGSDQMLPGGNLPSPPEPTGLDIPSTPFKLSFESPDAQKGTVKLQLNMRLEYAFGLKTSHFIPIPTGIEVSEKSQTTLLPLDVPLPTSVLVQPRGGIKEATSSTAASTEDSATNVPLTKEFLSSGKMLEAKQKALGVAVKSSTNPITGKIL
jgi:hypothetical protein